MGVLFDASSTALNRNVDIIEINLINGGFYTRILYLTKQSAAKIINLFDNPNKNDEKVIFYDKN